MTLYTALAIQNNGDNIRCEPYGQHAETKKWAGAINLYHDGTFHTTLVSSKAVFDSSEAAVSCMEDVVKQIRATKILG